MTEPGHIALPVDEHYGVGPYSDVYSHGPVVVLTPPGEDGMRLAACLDCGFISDEIRRFLHAECDRSKNPINQTYRERIADRGFPDRPEWDADA